MAVGRPRVYKTEGVTLKHTPLGEADRLLAIYTRDFGKIRVVARGVRRPKSKLAGHLELLTRARLMLAQGKSLDVVAQSETVQSFLAIRNDLWRSACAMYVAELVDRFTGELIQNEPLYGLLLDTLGRLEKAPSTDGVLRYFEFHLLSHLGYSPQLYHCTECRSVVAPEAHYFSASGGGILCPGCRSKQPVARHISLNALKVLRLISRADYDAMRRMRIAPELAAELEQLMRQYISYLLEGEVKSARFLDLLRKQGAGQVETGQNISK